MNEFTITGVQSAKLMEAISSFGDQFTDVTLTMQGNGDLIVGFGLVTVEISTEGDVEEI